MDNKSLPQLNKVVAGSRNILTIALSMLITGLVVGGTVYAWQKSFLNKTKQSLQTKNATLQNQIKELQVALQQEQSVTTRDENTASTESVISDNRNTYSNEELGYRIDYPSDWELTEYNWDEISISYPGWREMPEGGGSVAVSVEDKTLDQFLAEHKDNPPYDGAIIKQEDYTLNGISGHKLVMTTAIGLDWSFIFISRANKSYIIRFDDYDDAHLRIVETFRFID